MREAGAYGAIFLWRREPGLFSPEQIALVETFARQVAIAIDNVHLSGRRKRRWNSRRPRVRSCARSPARRRMSSRCSRPLRPTRFASARPRSASVTGSTASYHSHSRSSSHETRRHRCVPRGVSVSAEPRGRHPAGDPHGRPGPRCRRPPGPGIPVPRRGEECRLPQRPRRADAARRAPDRSDIGLSRRAQIVSGDAGRAAADVRGPGGHRGRERPSVRGTGNPEPRPHAKRWSSRRATGRRPAGQSPARRPTFSPCSRRSSRRRPIVRRARCRRIPESRATCAVAPPRRGVGRRA